LKFLTMTTAATHDTSIKIHWADADGEFRRHPSSYRDCVSREANAKFQPEPNRYHLYVSYACPWAHRTLIVRALKKMNDIISISVVNHHLDEHGWHFSTPEECPGAIPDTVNGKKLLRDIYLLASPDYEGRYTVPVLWDKKTKTIVNNESSEIIRMFNTEFDEFLPESVRGVTYYPQAYRKQIDEVNDWVYDKINNGVYKAGFATKQAVYETHCKNVFEALDRVEAILAKQPYLVGDQFTEADIRLFTTVLRFDPVYHGHFKCNLKSITHDYPHTLNWLRRIYNMPCVAETCNMEHIRWHYYGSHKNINPNGIVGMSLGPNLAQKL